MMREASPPEATFARGFKAPLIDGDIKFHHIRAFCGNLLSSKRMENWAYFIPSSGVCSTMAFSKIFAVFLRGL